MKLSKIILTGSLMLPLSCQKAPIPLQPLAKIITEMIVTDQRIQDEPTLFSIADTAQVYTAILQKYGYRTDDFLQSVDHYTRSPEKFKKALQYQRDLIEIQKTALEQQWEKLNRKPDSLLINFFDSLWRAPSSFPPRLPIDTLPSFRLYHPPDTLIHTPDSCSFTK